jgi:Raf kinase inhibitor-like YbhB/YbcL family protein
VELHRTDIDEEASMGFALSDMQISSPAFQQGSPIPSRHTGEGDDVSPPLSWTNVPAEARSFAVFCHDPDAPLVSAGGTYGFVHWVLYNIPATVTQLPEGIADYTAGRNDFGKSGYGGPMPPGSHGTHQYYFWILALNGAPKLDAGLSLWQLLERIEPGIIAMNRLVGTCERS